jgi:hypothetical protein
VWNFYACDLKLNLKLEYASTFYSPLVFFYASTWPTIAEFQCSFLSTIYISTLHISKVSIFQWQVFQLAYISTTIFQLHEWGSALRATTVFVCPALAIASLCLRASAFPLSPSSIYHIITQKVKISLANIHTQTSTMSTNHWNIKSLKYGCIVF